MLYSSATTIIKFCNFNATTIHVTGAIEGLLWSTASTLNSAHPSLLLILTCTHSMDNEYLDRSLLEHKYEVDFSSKGKRNKNKQREEAQRARYTS